MGKVILSMFVSLDGFIEGPNREMVVPAYSPDLQRYWIDDNLKRAGITMYGRTAFEGMAAYWTSSSADQKQAKVLADMGKLVFSRTLTKTNWANTTIISDDIAAKIGRLKQQEDKDLLLIGGAGIAQSFMQLGLIDEYNLIINTIVLGGGTRLFQGDYPRKNLALIESRQFDTGVMLVRYAAGEAGK